MLKISKGQITMSMENFAEALMVAATDKELQDKLLSSFRTMESYCNPVGYGDEEPIGAATEEDLRYEVVGTFIDHMTTEEEVNEPVLDEEDEDLPF